MAKSEMGFFKVIVRPLWASLNDFFVKIKSYLRMMNCRFRLTTLTTQSLAGRRFTMPTSQRKPKILKNHHDVHLYLETTLVESLCIT
jgi:hypothetical protein